MANVATTLVWVRYPRQSSTKSRRTSICLRCIADAPTPPLYKSSSIGNIDVAIKIMFDKISIIDINHAFWHQFRQMRHLCSVFPGWKKGGGEFSEEYGIYRGKLVAVSVQWWLLFLGTGLVVQRRSGQSDRHQSFGRVDISEHRWMRGKKRVNCVRSTVNMWRAVSAGAQSAVRCKRTIEWAVRATRWAIQS